VLPPCEPAPRAKARGRLNRATLFAAGAALIGAATCDSNRSANAHYGLPGIALNPDAGDAGGQDMAGDAPTIGSVQALYGGPMVVSTPDATNDTLDAAADVSDVSDADTE
jgi:hypothetical protein